MSRNQGSFLEGRGESGKMKVRKVATMIEFFKVLKFSRDCFEMDMHFYVFLTFL